MKKLLPSNIQLELYIKIWCEPQNYRKHLQQRTIILKLKRFGVVLDSNESLGPIINYLKYLQIIQFNFLTFKDGRPFTLAKNLRRKFNFKNEIRASGHILPDQYSFLIRCGFDSVEIKQTDKLTWLKVLGMEAEEYYQPF